MLPVLHNNSMMAPFTAGPIPRWDTFFDRVFGDDGSFPGQGRAHAWAGVPVALWDDPENVYVEAELPGVADEDVDISVHNGMLFIRGERKPEEGRRYLYNGRSYGRFERVITLPEAVQTDGVQAKLTGGVLSVTLPKSPEARPRKIMLTTN